MRSRIEQLAPDDVERLYVGTFHAFACEILRQSGSHVGVQTDFKIYSNPGDRELLLTEALRVADVDLGEPISKAFPVLDGRSEEHGSELQSLIRTSYAVFCLKKKE